MITMKRVGQILVSALFALLAVVPGVAHHAILAKFDDSKIVTLDGIVTLVHWKSPHAHIFVNVRDSDRLANWAIELESPIDLERSGWRRESLRPGDAITVEGIAARDESRQVWANSIVMTATGRRVLDVTPAEPPVPQEARPTPRWPDGRPRLGPPPGGTGYWGYPSATSLVETGVQVEVDSHGLLRNVEDADRVAPFQQWARDLYLYRQRNFLRDDPGFLFCKPPAGPRQYQLPYGIQFVDDRDFERIFVLIGSGNRNFRVIYMDGRTHEGQLQGDHDNPLYYGRSVGRWEGDTLVVESTGFNEGFWFSNGGHPHTERLQMIEHFSRPDFHTLRYEVTIDDPGAYTRPWSSSWTLRWAAGEELPVYFCEENRP